MDKNEIKALSQEELDERIAVEVESLQKLRFAHAISPLENPMRIKHSKRLVARLKTEHTSRKLANA
jgi:large subunit ribosomal protein L29